MQAEPQTQSIGIGRSTAAALLGLAPATFLNQNEVHASNESSYKYLQTSVQSGIAAGFQIASANGPLCDEPLWGIAFEASPAVYQDYNPSCCKVR